MLRAPVVPDTDISPPDRAVEALDRVYMDVVTCKFVGRMNNGFVAGKGDTELPESGVVVGMKHAAGSDHVSKNGADFCGR
jgi:hypothetical protein